MLLLPDAAMIADRRRYQRCRLPPAQEPPGLREPRVGLAKTAWTDRKASVAQPAPKAKPGTTARTARTVLVGLPVSPARLVATAPRLAKKETKEPRAPLVRLVPLVRELSRVVLGCTSLVVALVLVLLARALE